jgi:hypothetical protein
MPNEIDRWKNRRHMAWVCMVAERASRIDINKG